MLKLMRRWVAAAERSLMSAELASQLTYRLDSSQESPSDSTSSTHQAHIYVQVALNLLFSIKFGVKIEEAHDAANLSF